MSERRVVVTGLGATTPLGGTIAETWDGILAGRSGAKPLPEEWLEQYELPVHFACTIAQKPEEVLTKVEVRRMDPSAQYAVIASRAAMEDAGSPEIDPLRLGVAIGTGHRRRVDPARPVGHPQGEGPAPGLPARRPDAHAEHLGGQRLARSSAPAPAPTPPSPPAPRARSRWARATT